MTSAQTDGVGQAPPFILPSDSPDRYDIPNRQAQWKSIKKRLRPQVVARDGYECRYCGTYCEADDGSFSGQIDHVVPLSKGGPNTLDNLVAACVPCNASKRDQIWTPNPQPETPRTPPSPEIAQLEHWAYMLEEFKCEFNVPRYIFEWLNDLVAVSFLHLSDPQERLDAIVLSLVSYANADRDGYAQFAAGCHSREVDAQ